MRNNISKLILISILSANGVALAEREPTAIEHSSSGLSKDVSKAIPKDFPEPQRPDPRPSESPHTGEGSKGDVPNGGGSSTSDHHGRGDTH